jgi:uncharacterized protein (TIGR01777 family)
LNHSDVVINLAGKSVNCRYTTKNKEEIIRSRVDATHIIGRAIQSCSHPPKVWINAGSAAIFGNSGEEIKNETSAIGDGFSPEVCKRWEKAFHDAHTPRTRKVFLRIGLVLQPGEGLLKPFINMVRCGIGGKIGSGEQYISWIHEKDFVNIVELSLTNKDMEGIVHCSSPYPVKNKDFMKALRQTCGVPFGFPNPAPLIHFGAVFIGTEGNLVLEGRRVVSKVLEDKKYQFVYPEIEGCA